MLLELTIRDFAIIDSLQLRFEPGFNVMTGETGAGKSIIIDAVGLLLGGRAMTEFVRQGADRAIVEGVFALDESHAAQMTPLLTEHGLWEDGDDNDGLLIITREINATGRNLCRINGRAVPLASLRDIAAPLVDIHGQSEHLSLINARHHIDLLDRFAGTLQQRALFREKASALRRVREAIRTLETSERELALRQDRLAYIIDEIDAASLSPDEEEALNRERRVLGNAEKLSALAEEAYAVLNEGMGDEVPALLVQMDQVVQALAGLERLDESLSDAKEVADQAFALLDDLARTLDRYRDSLEFNPHRLEEIERRLSLIFQLKRKYGDTIAEILETRAQAAAELEEIEGAEERLVALREEEEQLLETLGHLGYELSAARREAAAKMARDVEQELADLRMERARFEVKIAWAADSDGVYVRDAFADETPGRYQFDATGIDQVEFLLAPNPGEGLKPLTKIASGGEASRIMLAIKTALGRADDTPTLIFDEIDTGVGGRVGHVVGQKLYSLARNRQVLCITHLPQLAAFGDQHFHIRKEIAGERTRTLVDVMDEEGRIAELAQMIGGGDAAWTAAAELRETVQRRNITEMRLS